MTGSAGPPLEEFGHSHAEIVGNTKNKKVAIALAKVFNDYGVLEREPRIDAGS